MCGLIVMHGFGKSNKITEQLCRVDGRGNGCDRVLNSGAGKFWEGVGISDIGLIYFATLFLFLLLGSIHNFSSQVILVLSIPASTAFVFTFFLFWYQWRIVKAWCRMCLIVSGLVWLQLGLLTAFIGSIYNIGFPLFRETIQGCLTLLLLSVVIASCWLPVKIVILKANDGDKSEIDLMKWKRNPNIFFSLLRQQRMVDDTRLWKDDIVLGNLSAQLQIIVACNPYCGPCAKAHEQFHELLTVYGSQFGLTIRFTVKALDSDDKKTIAVSNILKAWKNYSQGRIKGEREPVADWFSEMDVEKFKRKWIGGSEGEENVDELLNRHNQWWKKTTIAFTPTVFMNGFEMPEQYKVNDLMLILPFIAENFGQLDTHLVAKEDFA